MHVLLTGGLGFIGRHLSVALLERGVRVTVVDLPRFGAVGLPAPSTARAGEAEIVVADIREPDAWSDALAGVDVVVHCAGVHRVDEVEARPLRHVDINVAGTRTLLERVVEHGVSRFVNLSSAKVYGQIPSGHASHEDDLVAPVDIYALGKVVGEQYCDTFAARHGLEVCSLRPFSVYGPGQETQTGYIGALLDGVVGGGHVVLPGDRETRRDFVYIDTVVDACVAAITSDTPPPRILNCGSGTSTTLPELVDLFTSAAGRPLRVTYRDARAGTLRETLADVTLLQQFADPRVPSLHEALAPTIGACLGRP